MVTEISYKMQTEEPEACSCTEFSKAFQDLKRVAASFFVKRQLKKKNHAFDYEVILP